LLSRSSDSLYCGITRGTLYFVRCSFASTARVVSSVSFIFGMKGDSSTADAERVRACDSCAKDESRLLDSLIVSYALCSVRTAESCIDLFSASLVAYVGRSSSALDRLELPLSLGGEADSLLLLILRLESLERRRGSLLLDRSRPLSRDLDVSLFSEVLRSRVPLRRSVLSLRCPSRLGGVLGFGDGTRFGIPSFVVGFVSSGS